jgi:flagellin
MTADIRGTAVAIRNANDAISLSQTAEGGLGQINDILQRMRELAVQAINSTNTSSDISALTEEYSQLGSELGRIISAVQFNGKTLFTSTASYNFQVGATSGQTITMASSMLNFQSAAGLSAVMNGGIYINSTSALNATANSANAINLTAIDLAIDTVNSARAQLGAIQSRFEKTINFLQTGIENQSAARGRIMDADFATETSNLSRVQILQQAGTAMIAQANQMPQSVLQLLKG